LRRLAILADFAGGAVAPAAIPLVRRAIDTLPARVTEAQTALKPWADRPLTVRPCLCDVWHDHVLFIGDTVTGLIDYGEVKPDHPAVDLARLLGDLVGDDDAKFRLGLDAYHAAGGPVIDAAFTRLLDRTGVVCAVIHWVKELTAGTAPVGAEVRLTRLLARLR
jgi:aminoglycoside phosphotransferase (APT) family kinase protein